MGEGVEVDRGVGHGQRVGPHLGLDDLGVLQVRGGRGAGGELGGELAEAQVLALVLDQAEGGGVPEAGGPAVAEHHLVAVGEGEELRRPPRTRPTCDLTVFWRWLVPEVGGGDLGQGGDLLGADLGGPGSEAAVGGPELGGDGDVGGVGHVWNHGIRDHRLRHANRTPPDLAPGRRRVARRPPWPSTPRPRRCRPPASTSSASGPASRTSPRRPTSSRRRSRPAGTRPTTTTRRPAGSRHCARPSPPRPCGTRASRSPPSRCWSPTGASRRWPTPSPCCAIPATRCSSWPPTGRPTPSRSPWPAGCRSSCRPTRRAASARASRSSRRRVTPRTKALLFVSPSNPTGAVYPRHEIEAIGRWAVERGLWVVTDEIYEHLVYGGAEHHSMPVLVPELADRCLVVNGVAKTYAMTGWRVGWLIGPDRRRHRRHQHPDPRDLQRGQRLPAGRAGRGLGRPGRRGHDAGRPSTAGAGPSSAC